MIKTIEKLKGPSSKEQIEILNMIKENYNLMQILITNYSQFVAKNKQSFPESPTTYNRNNKKAI